MSLLATRIQPPGVVCEGRRCGGRVRTATARSIADCSRSKDRSLCPSGVLDARRGRRRVARGARSRANGGADCTTWPPDGASVSGPPCWLEGTPKVPAPSGFDASHREYPREWRWVLG